MPSTTQYKELRTSIKSCKCWCEWGQRPGSGVPEPGKEAHLHLCEFVLYVPPALLNPEMLHFDFTFRGPEIKLYFTLIEDTRYPCVRCGQTFGFATSEALINKHCFLIPMQFNWVSALPKFPHDWKHLKPLPYFPNIILRSRRNTSLHPWQHTSKIFCLTCVTCNS